MLKKVAVATILLVLPASASSEPFKSEQLGFSADFPGEAQVSNPDIVQSDPKPLETTLVSSSEEGVYSAGVEVDVFNGPEAFDVAGSLDASRDLSISAFGSRLLTTKRGTVGGYRAEFYTFVTYFDFLKALNLGDGSGGGVVVFVPGQHPRIYVLVMWHSSGASTEQVAKLAKFAHSLRIIPHR